MDDNSETNLSQLVWLSSNISVPIRDYGNCSRLSAMALAHVQAGWTNWKTYFTIEVEIVSSRTSEHNDWHTFEEGLYLQSRSIIINVS